MYFSSKIMLLKVCIDDAMLTALNSNKSQSIEGQAMWNIEFSLVYQTRSLLIRAQSFQAKWYIRIALRYSAIDRVKPREPRTSLYLYPKYRYGRPYFKIIFNEYFGESPIDT